MNKFKFLGRIFQLSHILLFLVMIWLVVTAGDWIDLEKPLLGLLLLLVAVVGSTINVYAIFKINEDIKKDEAR